MATQPQPEPPGQPTPIPTELPPMAPDVDIPDAGSDPMPTGPANPQ